MAPPAPLLLAESRKLPNRCEFGNFLSASPAGWRSWGASPSCGRRTHVAGDAGSRKRRRNRSAAPISPRTPRKERSHAFVVDADRRRGGAQAFVVAQVLACTVVWQPAQDAARGASPQRRNCALRAFQKVKNRKLRFLYQRRNLLATRGTAAAAAASLRRRVPPRPRHTAAASHRRRVSSSTRRHAAAPAPPPLLCRSVVRQLDRRLQIERGLRSTTCSSSTGFRTSRLTGRSLRQSQRSRSVEVGNADPTIKRQRPSLAFSLRQRPRKGLPDPIAVESAKDKSSDQIGEGVRNGRNFQVHSGQVVCHFLRLSSHAGATASKQTPSWRTVRHGATGAAMACRENDHHGRECLAMPLPKKGNRRRH